MPSIAHPLSTPCGVTEPSTPYCRYHHYKILYYTVRCEFPYRSRTSGSDERVPDESNIHRDSSCRATLSAIRVSCSAPSPWGWSRPPLPISCEANGEEPVSVDRRTRPRTRLRAPLQRPIRNGPTVRSRRPCSSRNGEHGIIGATVGTCVVGVARSRSRQPGRTTRRAPSATRFNDPPGRRGISGGCRPVPPRRRVDSVAPGGGMSMTHRSPSSRQRGVPSTIEDFIYSLCAFRSSFF